MVLVDIVTAIKTIIKNYVWETNVQQTNLLIINKHVSTFNQIPRASERAQNVFFVHLTVDSLSFFCIHLC